jgi:hypothetical protein
MRKFRERQGMMIEDTKYKKIREKQKIQEKTRENKKYKGRQEK